MDDGEGADEAPAVGGLLRDARANAVVAWTLVAFVVVVAAVNAAVGEVAWAVFAASIAVLALFPAFTLRDPKAMLPWEVLGLAVLPLLGRTFASFPVTSDLATYLSVAALALVVAVELDAFTPVEMSIGFAVFFVVVATIATAGAWAVARYGLDTLLGTGFLLEPGLTEDEIERGLMFEFVYSTASGVLAGVVFEGYFRRIRYPERPRPGTGEPGRERGTDERVEP